MLGGLFCIVYYLPGLVLLGVSSLETPSFDSLSSIFLILISTFSLILLTKSIIYQSQNWYLTTDYVSFRGFIVTFLIIFSSTFIVWISGTINKNYNFGISQNPTELIALVKCFLLAILSLIIPSTFFMSSLTSKVDLVGLPSNSFVELIQKLDFKMRELIKIKNWKNYTDYKQNFIEVIDEVETIIKEIEKLKGNNFAKKSFNEIKDDLGNLKKD